MTSLRVWMTVTAAFGSAMIGLALPAAAQTTASATVNITATIAPTCTITPSGGTATTGNAGLLATVDFSSTPATPSADIVIGSGSTTSGTLAGHAAACNVATRVRVNSQNGAATTAGTPGASFQNFFDYTAQVTFDTVSVTLNTSTTPAAAGVETITSAGSTSGPFSGALGIAVTSLAHTLPLMVGTYNDTVTITLLAN